ncbi:MAG: alpha-L-fucosidase [Eubacterium sp.]|nr:alpha-L-fucosidase [Eubacterium sp.]
MLYLSKEVIALNKKEYLSLIDEVIEKGKYKADWASLSNHKTPEWYRQRKLGIFIHWGIYSVPAFGNEWYSRSMYDKNVREFEHHRKTYGEQKNFGYKDFIPMFKAENFDPEKWAKLFKESGAGYVMPVCEHHDGFAMYDTEFNRWNAKNMGPKRNVIGELKEAVEKEGLVFCGSTHRAEHYFFMNPGRMFDSDIKDDENADFYGPAVYSEEYSPKNMGKATENVYSTGASEEWLNDWMVRTCELIDRYQPKILYFDWWIQNHSFKPYLKKIAAYYYNRAEEWGYEVTINYKHEAFPPTVATFDVERGALTDISPVPWQTDTAIGRRSWGYTKDNDFKGSRQIIGDLIDIVSKNGMLLLNIGPRPDGTITDEETKVLTDLGSWLKKNGEGIYGTTFWKQFGEGKVNASAGFFQDGDEKQFTHKDFRFTYKDACVYAFQMRPDGRNVKIKAFAKKDMRDFIVDKVTLLETGEELEFERNDKEMIIKANESFKSEFPICFKIKLK